MELTKEWQEINSVYVGNTGYGDVYLNFMAILVSQDIANNKSHIGLGLRIYTSNGNWSSQMNDTLDGNYQDLGYKSFSAGHEFIHIIEKDIAHNDNGIGSGSFNGSIWTYFFGTTSGSASFTLPTIPRYTTIASHYVESKTETSVTIVWNATDSCDSSATQYSINGGAWRNGGNWPRYTISGLSANTNYSIRTRVKRLDSGLYTVSDPLSVTTYDYPYINSVETSDLKIGSSQKLKFYNPLNRAFTLKMYQNNTSGQALYSEGSINGTSKSFTPNSNTLYNSIPNSKNSNCVYSVIYGNSVRTTGTYKYSVVESNCVPIFEDFSIENIDSATKDITGNNQFLVDNYSICRFKIPIGGKATARNGASISKYICAWGNSNNFAYENTSKDINCDVNKGNGNTLKITVVDSRGISKVVSKGCNNISYVNAIINEIDTQRKNGIDAETYLKIKATIWSGNWNNNTDEDYKNQLKYVGYRVQDGNTWSDWYDITTIFKEKMSSFVSGNSNILEIDFNDKLQIHSNGTSNGFTSGQAFVIQVLIKDGISSKVFTPSNYQAILQGNVTDGQIGMARYKDSDGQYHYGINGMPDSNFTFNVVGKYAIDGILLFEVIDE